MKQTNEHAHKQAMQTIRKERDFAAIAEGIAQMEAGQSRPLAEVDADMRREFEFLRRK